MKKWILTICRIAPKINKIVGETERKIEKLSLRLDMPTLEQYCEILTLTDRKNLCINLKILYDIMKKKLKKDELRLLTAYAKGSGYTLLSHRIALSPSTLFYRISKIAGVVAKEYQRAGYDESRMEKDFSTLDFVCRELNALKTRVAQKRGKVSVA